LQWKSSGNERVSFWWKKPSQGRKNKPSQGRKNEPSQGRKGGLSVKKK